MKAEELRDQHVDVLQEQLIENGQTTKAAAIQQKHNREKIRRCWRILKLLQAGTKATGGISHVLVPSQNPHDPPRRVQVKEELDETILERNIKHFSQAHGTPFTVEPLSMVLGYDGCTPQAQQIL
jgi:hypothetical protein